MLGLVEDEERVDKIIEVTRDVHRYGFYKSSIDIGVGYSPRDLTFSQMMLYSWIKDGLSGRKN